TRRPITGAGVRRTCRTGWAMAAFEYRQAQEIRDCFQRHGIRYLFLGKSGAILLGFPDTTQDADLFVEKTPENCAALVLALRELGFALSEAQAAEVERGKISSNSRTVPLISTSYSPRTVSSDLVTPGAGAWRSKGFRSATST